MKKRAKKITLESLAGSVEDLAAMTAKGFENTATKADVVRLDNRLGKLEQGQEDIKLKLDNVAYRFELVELQKRVERLEQKTGIRAR